MACACHLHQLDWRGNSGNCLPQFPDCGEWISTSMNEQHWSVYRGKMSHPQLLRFIRWMQRIAQQHKRLGHRSILGQQHARLPPAIGMPRKNHSLEPKLPDYRHRLPQPLPVCGASGRVRGPLRTALAKRQVDPQCEHPRLTKACRGMH